MVTPVDIRLGPDEDAVARLIGTRRNTTCEEAGSPPGWTPDHDTRERQHQDGAGAELAVCIATGGYWEAIRSVGHANAECDVRVGNLKLQVRSSPHNGAHLVTYPEDNPEHWFVLVTGRLPRYTVHGIIRGRDGMVDQYRRTHLPNGDPLIHPTKPGCQYVEWWTPRCDLLRVRTVTVGGFGP